MKTLTVLFIDDDIFMLKALNRVASRLKPHWQFYLCSDPLHWQQALPDGAIVDTVICDYLMPDINGDELLKQVSQIMPSALRVLLTGDTAEDVVSKVTEIAHFVLKKPFTQQDINDVFCSLEHLNTLEIEQPLRNKLGRIGYFFALPDIARQIQSMFANEEVDISHAADIIHQESVIAAKLIQIANSAFLGYSRKTVSLEEAIKRLGLKMTETIVVSMVVDQALALRVPEKAHKKINEWSFNYSRLCRQLSKSMGFSVEQQDVVFIAALLSGIGHLVLMSETNEHVDFDSDDTHTMLADATVLTVYILTLWGYPLDLCELILMQDKPDFNATGLNVNTLGLILYVVNLSLTHQLDEPSKNELLNLVVDVDIRQWISNS
ncbi:HDOD domain-containing protein [Shewanella sp. SR44-4]|mgnify:CR=1 FL=1|uniref:HDOD domain-containing protein n=1 Tax=Shewanella sp. SR44-4 TaxID=2760935 RepID=UPI0015FEDD16|nr:HDOD domain-containing protein [Shewanella sp. SR44-4]MBB1361023.1 HDOD domain-containing protein [Shewanella sp. SR44-4]|tara:strand:- start:1054 stop:2187 length:1134 start_codon:yes stop_codon:yes gene_type:complete